SVAGLPHRSEAVERLRLAAVEEADVRGGAEDHLPVPRLPWSARVDQLPVVAEVVHRHVRLVRRCLSHGSAADGDAGAPEDVALPLTGGQGEVRPSHEGGRTEDLAAADRARRSGCSRRAGRPRRACRTGEPGRPRLTPVERVLVEPALLALVDVAYP